ncbi:zinc finger protein [Poronia punctata]|nr:zinc finger protein [Poronia punctata]
MGVRNKRTLTKTRRHVRDLDQIKADLNSQKHLSQYKDMKPNEDLPGLGRWYCVECAKWYDTESNLILHRKGKPHKRRVKQLREQPYTQKEAEAAIGLGVNAHPPHGTDTTADNEVEMVS